jgi:lysine 6-dehydrogenase
MSGFLHFWLTDRGMGGSVVRSITMEPGSAAYEEAMDECGGVLSCIPYTATACVLRDAVERGINYVDLGCEPADIEAARSALPEGAPRATWIFDAGLAPGLLNQLGEGLIKDWPEAESLQLFCGGLPVEPWGPFGYYPYFSPESVVAEYQDEAVVLRDGAVIHRPGLSDLEEVEIPGAGRFEAFLTSGGESDAPTRLSNKISSFEYKTLRYPGHCAAMTLMRDAGMWSKEPLAEDETPPLTTFLRLLAPKGALAPHDKVIGMARATGSGQTKTAHFVQESDYFLHISAMSKMTGFPAAIVMDQIMKNPPEGLKSAGEWGRSDEMVEALAGLGVHVKFN